MANVGHAQKGLPSKSFRVYPWLPKDCNPEPTDQSMKPGVPFAQMFAQRPQCLGELTELKLPKTQKAGLRRFKGVERQADLVLVPEDPSRALFGEVPNAAGHGDFQPFTALLLHVLRLSPPSGRTAAERRTSEPSSS